MFIRAANSVQAQGRKQISVLDSFRKFQIQTFQDIIWLKLPRNDKRRTMTQKEETTGKKKRKKHYWGNKQDMDV